MLVGEAGLEVVAVRKHDTEPITRETLKAELLRTIRLDPEVANAIATQIQLLGLPRRPTMAETIYGLPAVDCGRLLPHLPTLTPEEEADLVVGTCDGPPATPEELENWRRIVGPASIQVKTP